MKNDELINLSGARNIIRDLNKLNLAKIHFSQIKKKLNPLLCTSFSGDLIAEGRQLFRANKIEEGRPSNAARLSYPPREFIEYYQRCNSPKKPIFYCASDELTACTEIHAQAGDTVYISNWRVVYPFFTINLNACQSYGPASDVVATFIEAKFLQEIHATFSYQYKMTAAIAEILFSYPHELNPVNDAFENGKIPYGVCSIAYPSATNHFHKLCFAIKTVAVDNCFQLESVQEVKLDWIKESDMHMTITGKSLSIDEDGTIEWDVDYEKGKVLPKWGLRLP